MREDERDSAVEYVREQAAPVGIGQRQPRFSWKHASVLQDVKQSYRCSSAESAFTGCSGTRVRCSPKSAHVSYAGPPLASSTRYFWRVRVRDNHGQESPWSETAFFETAILDASLAGSLRFSGGRRRCGLLPGDAPARRITLEGETGVGADLGHRPGLYELSVNGTRVGDALFDARLDLVRGRPPVPDLGRHRSPAIRWKTSSAPRSAPAGTRATSWVAEARACTARVPPCSCRCTCAQRTARRGCSAPTGNGKRRKGPSCTRSCTTERPTTRDWKRRGWEPRGSTTVHGSPPWRWTATCRCSSPRKGRRCDGRRRCPPAALITTPKGERVLDFGQNLAGWVRFTVRGKAGQKVVLRHAEILDAAGNFYTANMRSAKVRVEYVLRGVGQEVFEPHFTFQGFRYVMIEEYPGEPSIDSFQAVVSAFRPGAHRYIRVLARAPG